MLKPPATAPAPGAGPHGAGPPDRAALEGVVVNLVRELALDLHPEAMRASTLGARASLERDFGLDSLARVELAARLERVTGVRLPEAAFTRAETPADLAESLSREPWRADDALAVGHGVVAAPGATLLQPSAAAEELPESVGTLVDALAWHARTHPDRVHLLLYGEHGIPEPLSYAQLQRMALEAAAGLARGCGVAPGDRVAIMLPTGVEFFAAFHGALLAGAVPVPLYPPARPSQIEDHLRRVAGIVSNAGARVLVTTPEARALAALLRPLAPSLRTVTEVGALRGHGVMPPVPGKPTDLAFLQYTSGSTGQPKGVMLTHANLMSNLRAMRAATGASSGDLFVSWLPLYHDMGLIGACLGAMCFGFPLALMSPFGFLSRPARWLWLLHRHRATITAGPNFAFEFCVSKVRDDEIAGLDLSSLRCVFNGAEPVSPDTVARFCDRFVRHGLRREAVAPVYGLAECSLGLTFPPAARGPLLDCIDRDALLHEGRALPAAADAASPVRLLSCGRVIGGHAVRIVAPDGSPLGERLQGEIEFRGPSATSGYHDNPQATARLVHDGWLRTGDLGYLADGELYVTGRTKDVIIRGGHNIHPQELEDAAMRVAGVRKGGVVVFPALDRASGTERLIVLAETAAVQPEARERIRAEIARLALDLIGLPADEVVLAPPHTVLKTSSGKLRRSACRERFERGEAAVPVRATWRQVLSIAGAGALARARRGLGRAGALLWGSWACLVFLLVAPLAFAAVVASPTLPSRRRAARLGARALFGLWGVLPRVEGEAQILTGEAHGGEAGPVQLRGRVVVANHSSYLDGLLLTAVLPPGLVFVAKRELEPQRFAGLLLRRLGALFVERFDAARGAQDAGLIDAALQRGDALVVFPEGTFEREAGLLPLRMGAFVGAAARGSAVVPVAILGTRRMLPDDDLFPSPGRLRVIVGEPMVAAGGGWDAAIVLRARVRSWLLAKTGEPDREAGTGGPPGSPG